MKSLFRFGSVLLCFCELFCLNDMTKKLLRLVYAASENEISAELFQSALLFFTSFFRTSFITLFFFFFFLGLVFFFFFDLVGEFIMVRGKTFPFL